MNPEPGQTTTSLPRAMTVRDLLRGMLGRDVDVATGASMVNPSLRGSALVGIFVNRFLKLSALMLLDIQLRPAQVRRSRWCRRAPRRRRSRTATCPSRCSTTPRRSSMSPRRCSTSGARRTSGSIGATRRATRCRTTSRGGAGVRAATRSHGGHQEVRRRCAFGDHRLRRWHWFDP